MDTLLSGRTCKAISVSVSLASVVTVFCLSWLRRGISHYRLAGIRCNFWFCYFGFGYFWFCYSGFGFRDGLFSNGHCSLRRLLGRLILFRRRLSCIGNLWLRLGSSRLISFRGRLAVRYRVFDRLCSIVLRTQFRQRFLRRRLRRCNRRGLGDRSRLRLGGCWLSATVGLLQHRAYGLAYRILGLFIAEHRQVKQDCVLTEQTPTGPAGLEDKAQIGLADNLVAGKHHIIALGSGFNGEADVGQETDAINIEALEVIHGGKLDGDIVKPGITQLQYLDANSKWLIQRRFDGDGTQTESKHLCRHTAQKHGQNDDGST